MRKPRVAVPLAEPVLALDCALLVGCGGGQAEDVRRQGLQAAVERAAVDRGDARSGEGGQVSSELLGLGHAVGGERGVGRDVGWRGVEGGVCARFGVYGPIKAELQRP